MNGADHYREAEHRLAQAHASEPEFAAYLVAKAQVHATLALAAAVADTQAPRPRVVDLPVTDPGRTDR